MEDSTCLSLCGQVGPGLSKDDPMALVVSDGEKRSGVSSAGEEQLVEQSDQGATHYSLSSSVSILKAIR